MNTLCTDLSNLLKLFLKASEAIVLNFKIEHDQEVLDVYGLSTSHPLGVYGKLRRFKIALKLKNYYWINELIKRIYDAKAVKWALKYNCHDIAIYLIKNRYNLERSSSEPGYIGCLFYYGYYDLVESETKCNNIEIDETYLSYYYYLCGRNKIIPDLNNASLIQKREFIRGLSRGQHKELFKLYSCGHTNIIDLLLNFDDEDYAISLLDPNVGKFRNIHYDIHRAINRNRFKVARFLFQICESKKLHIFRETSFTLISKSKIDLFDDIDSNLSLKGSVLENYIYISCMKSDVRTLRLILSKIKNQHKDEYLYLLAKHCVSYEVYDYYTQLLNGSTSLIVLDDNKKKLMMLIDELRPYIPDYVLSIKNIPTTEELIRNVLIYYSGNRGRHDLKTIKLIINILHSNDLSIDKIIEIFECRTGSYVHLDYDNFHYYFTSLDKNNQVNLIKSMLY